MFGVARSDNEKTRGVEVSVQVPEMNSKTGAPRGLGGRSTGHEARIRESHQFRGRKELVPSHISGYKNKELSENQG